MASTSERGHAKNVANLNTLITYLTSLEAKYNPTKEAINVANLQTLYNDCSTAMGNIKIVLPPYSTAVDKQELAFKPLSKLTTKILNSYATVVEDKAQLQTAISLKNKITGSGIKPKKPANPDEDTVSQSRLSYDNRVDNLLALIKVLENDSSYKPNEPELQIASLTTYANDLKTKTEAVDTELAKVLIAKEQRNLLLYSSKTGLLDRVKDIKTYIISVYGTNSPQIRYINKLKFGPIK